MEVRCGDPLVTQHEGGHGGLAVPVLIADQPPLPDDGVLGVGDVGAGGRPVLAGHSCSAANRSIGSTTGFHNHGEGPY